MGEQAKEAVEHVADAASECCSAWADQFRHCAESAEQFVRQKPVQALAIAAGVGLLIGLAVRR